MDSLVNNSSPEYSVILSSKDLQQTLHLECFNNCTCYSNYTDCADTVAPPIVDWTGCIWSHGNHGFFQAANAFLFLSYLSPNGIYGILFLRTVLAFASVCFCLWAWVVLCAPDTLAWNFIFGIINITQACIIIHKVWPEKFTPEGEEVFRRLFKPLNVPRHSFKHLIAIARKEHLQEGEYYAKEGETVADSLSLLCSGSLNVLLKDEFLHNIGEYEFIDSPEYLSFKDGECFQVSLVAREECWYFRWSQSQLRKLFQKEAFLRSVIENMAGRDVTEKLFVLNKIVMRQTGGRTPDIRMPSVLSLHLPRIVEEPLLIPALSKSTGALHEYSMMNMETVL